MSTTADQLVRVQTQLEHHWFSLHLHQDAIRTLQVEERMLREAVAREEAAELKQAKRWCGAEARRSA